MERGYTLIIGQIYPYGVPGFTFLSSVNNTQFCTWNSITFNDYFIYWRSVFCSRRENIFCEFLNLKFPFCTRTVVIFFSLLNTLLRKNVLQQEKMRFTQLRSPSWYTNNTCAQFSSNAFLFKAFSSYPIWLGWIRLGSDWMKIFGRKVGLPYSLPLSHRVHSYR